MTVYDVVYDAVPGAGQGTKPGRHLCGFRHTHEAAQFLADRCNEKAGSGVRYFVIAIDEEDPARAYDDDPIRGPDGVML